MNQQTEIINKFYSCFQKKDYKSMIDCYHPDINFKDELFDLKSKQVAAMWHMFCGNGKDLEISYSNINVTEKSGFTSWEAKYTFPKTKRYVHNKINSQFEFKDGKIINHIDSFNFWKWSSQSFGMVGLLFGWTFFLRKKVSKSANIALNRFIEKHPEYK